MNEHTTIGHNSKSKTKLPERFKSYGKQFDAIRDLAIESDQFVLGHHAKVRQSLALLYALGKTLKEKELVEQFCKACNGSWGKKADENYFHELVSLAFVEVREDSRSKYRKILQYADFRQWDAKQFSDVLNKEDKGVEKLYKDGVQALNHNYDAEYNEESNERYQRARISLKQQRLCSPIKINIKGKHPVSVDGYSTAIVRLKGNSLEVVDFATGQTKDLLKRAVANLVGPEPKGLRKKLKEKNLYWFYTFIDVFSRFIPTQKEIESELAHQHVDQSFLKLVEKFKTDPKDAQKLLDGNRRREAKGRIKADLQRFDYRIALKLEVCGGGWVGETISTLPSAPSVCFKFKDFDKVFDQTKILAIHGLSAKSLKEDFFHRDEWQLQPNLDGYRLRPATKDDKKAQIQLFDPTPEWHGPLRQMSVWCSFEMTSKHIVDLNHWRSDRDNIKSFTRPKPFPKYLELESDNGKLVLVFPTDKTQRLEFGQLVKTKNNAKLPSLHMGPRYVPTKQIESLAQLAMDYDLTFNGAILMGKKWPAALQFTAFGFHCDLTITIPLYQGKTGHSVEILELM